MGTNEELNETLLDKAIQNYNFAINSWVHRLDDEVYLNYIAYFLQQSVEIALKYTLQENGIRYDKTHNIEQLLYIGQKRNIEMHAGEYISDHAEMFTSWETCTRYVLNYRVELKKIERALAEVGKYLQKLQSLELEKAVEDQQECQGYTSEDIEDTEQPEPEEEYWYDEPEL